MNYYTETGRLKAIGIIWEGFEGQRGRTTVANAYVDLKDFLSLKVKTPEDFN